jgi:hypothetical protein
MNFERERNCFYHLRDKISDEAKAEYELGVSSLVQRYNTAIYENRFLAGGVVEIFTLALMRSTGIDIADYGARGVGGDLILPAGEIISVKSCFTRSRGVILVNTRDDSYTPWTTPTLFVLSNIGIVYGDPDMVNTEEDLKRSNDNLSIRPAAVNRLAEDSLHRIPMRIPFKPPASEAGNSQKASDAVAIQLMNELEMNTLSDQVLSDLTDSSQPDDSGKQITLDIS